MFRLHFKCFKLNEVQEEKQEVEVKCCRVGILTNYSSTALRSPFPHKGRHIGSLREGAPPKAVEEHAFARKKQRKDSAPIYAQNREQILQ